MSSATSTKSAEDGGLQTWQFFLLAALGCATAVTFLARGQGIVSIILLGILMITTAAVGIAVLRMVRPLVSSEEDRTVMIGHRTRAALEREKRWASWRKPTFRRCRPAGACARPASSVNSTQGRDTAIRSNAISPLG